MYLVLVPSYWQSSDNILETKNYKSQINTTSLKIILFN